LLEVIVAVAIVAIAMMAMLVIRSNAVSEAVNAKWGQTAATLASLQMGRIQLEIEQEKYLTTDTGTFEEDGFPEFTYEVTKEIQTFFLGYNDDDEEIEKDLFQVTLRVGYPPNPESNVIELTQLIRVPEEEKTE
jgi:type II secretory pathway pseudopilin PulG